MAKIRLERVAEQMKHVISRVVTQELKDPRSGFITIIDVKVAPDLKTARVAFSVLGSEPQKRTGERALQSARGFIQARVAEEVQLKYTPVITFHLDESVERDIVMQRKIERVRATDKRVAAAKRIRERIAAGSIPPNVVDEMAAAAESEEFIESIARLLTSLMAVDTTPPKNAKEAAAAEGKCFEVLQAAFAAAWADEIETELIPMDPEVEKDSAYTLPQITGPDGNPVSAVETYAGRSNLIAVLRANADEQPQPEAEEGLGPLRLVLSTHIDTAGPYESAVRSGDELSGSGACDAKGQAAMILGAFQILRRLRDKLGVRLQSDLGAQFVIDEQCGGNGSLCLALQDPFPFDGIVVCKPTDSRLYVGCRGTIGYL